MTLTCPNGHGSQADDFCDTCGARIDPEQQPAVAAPRAGETGLEAADVAAGATQTCPHCETANLPDALFCEACGYDFTTGALPRSAAPVGGAGPRGAQAPSPGDAQTAEEPLAEEEAGTAGDPRTAGTGAAAAGGGSIAPRIPLEWVAEVWVDPQWYAGQDAEEPMPSPGLPDVVPLRRRSLLVGRVSVSRNITPDIDATSDTGVSRRHAQLTTDGRRWFVEDLGSSNGTFVGPASGPLPEEPIPVGSRTELDADDRIYVGAWTRIVIRPATEEERASASG